MNKSAQKLGSLGGKARWRNVSKKKRSEIMSEVRRIGLKNHPYKSKVK